MLSSSNALNYAKSNQSNQENCPIKSRKLPNQIKKNQPTSPQRKSGL